MCLAENLLFAEKKSFNAQLITYSPCVLLPKKLCYNYQMNKPE
jgi:hypothetical protein